ncbi:MAG: hypothetical protein EU542_09265 [Promethearchaeota archaeon]|nr:MAG: hypothetical protein EU542_09265 [Candidatus Lokiarchaeota archaeon]
MNMIHKRLIGLITDFGLRGWHYVTAMKAVIIGINPKARIIDIHHHITPYSIIEASFIIKTVYKLFPHNSIFVIVVDPGVGSSRKIIALKTKSNHYFIGPDNGIFWVAFDKNEIKECVAVQNDEFYHKPVSNTFHGRDIMAPIGAYLSKGISLFEFGKEFEPKNLITYPITYEVFTNNKTIICTIQYIDNFGNVVTNIPINNNKIEGTKLKLNKNSLMTLIIDENEYQGNFQFQYKNTTLNQLIFIKGSSNYLEISMNQESAAKKFNLHTGDTVKIKL